MIPQIDRTVIDGASEVQPSGLVDIYHMPPTDTRFCLTERKASRRLFDWPKESRYDANEAFTPHFKTKKRKAMKEYKVETLIYHSKLTLDSKHIAEKSKEEIQEKLDEYSENGYVLISTSSAAFGLAIYIYLFFGKDV